MYKITKTTTVTCVTLLALLGASSCSEVKKESTAKPWQMGEKVPLGPFTYSVIDSEWKTDVMTAKGRLDPKQRFLVLRLTVANSAAEPKAISYLAIRNDKGEETTEVQDLEGVEGWMGVLRDIPASGSTTGTIIFDVPLGHYRLVLNDGGAAGEERLSLVDLPINLRPGEDDKPITGK